MLNLIRKIAKAYDAAMERVSVNTAADQAQVLDIDIEQNGFDLM